MRRSLLALLERIERHHARRARRWPAHHGRPAVTTARPCYVDCGSAAQVMVMRQTGGVVEVLDVCRRCGQEGEALGWWLPFAVGAAS